MSTIKQPASTQVSNKEGYTVTGGNNLAVNPNNNTGYIPSGILIAMISKALREAQDNDLEMQKDQAQAEQEYYKVLGNLGGDPSKGIIAQSAQATVNQGIEQAKGLRLTGIFSAIGAGVSAVAAGIMFGKGVYENYKASGIEEEINGLKKDNIPDGPTKAGMGITDKSSVAANEDPELERETQEFKDGKPVSQEAKEAAKVNNQDDLAERKANDNKKIEDLQEQKERRLKAVEQFISSANTVSSIASSATQAAGNLTKAPHDAAAAAQQATADVAKTLQQMDTTAASSFQDYAHAKAQQALQTADTLAQVAQSQVQMRG